MATKKKQAKPRMQRKLTGVQVVLRVPAEVKALLQKMAHDGYCSMNHAATERLATGVWPKKKEVMS